MGKKEKKIKPFGGRILIQRIEKEEVKKGGIIIPDTAKEKPQQGKVIAVSGDPCYQSGQKIEFNECMEEGDIVLFGKFAGTEIEFEGESYIIMEQTDILAKIK